MPYYRNWYLYAGFVRGMQLPPLQVADLDWQAKGGQVNQRNDMMRKGLTSFIEAKVKGDPELMAKLVPKYAPLDNVELVTEPIEKFVHDGIITKDGIHRKLDLVVLGCGFKPTSFLYPVEYRGRDGITLDQTWQKDGARSYLGLTIPRYPNLFTLYGPNHQPRGGLSLHSWSEIWGRYALSMIVWMIENEAKAVDVKQAVYDAYQVELDEAQIPLIWDGEGRGYFINEQGRQAVNMPWTSDVHHARVVTPDLGDYNVHY
ncbi:hypothetical protein BDW75DRAFT_243421 [Aspergillus navahoensis]